MDNIEMALLNKVSDILIQMRAAVELNARDQAHGMGDKLMAELARIFAAFSQEPAAFTKNQEIHDKLYDIADIYEKACNEKWWYA